LHRSRLWCTKRVHARPFLFPHLQVRADVANESGGDIIEPSEHNERLITSQALVWSRRLRASLGSAFDEWMIGVKGGVICHLSMYFLVPLPLFYAWQSLSRSLFFPKREPDSNPFGYLFPFNPTPTYLSNHRARWQTRSVLRCQLHRAKYGSSNGLTRPIHLYDTSRCIWTCDRSYPPCPNGGSASMIM
jgi:hypothetical protein